MEENASMHLPPALIPIRRRKATTVTLRPKACREHTLKDAYPLLVWGE